MSETLTRPATRQRTPLSVVSRRLGRSDEAAFQRIMDNIAELGLNENLLELLSVGYTVVPGVLSQDRIDRAKAAILRRVESKLGRPIDPQTATSDDFAGMAYQHYLLFEDPVFQEILMEPRPLALMTYLLGESCVLSSMGSHFRGPGGLPLAFHADGSATGLMSKTSMVANCNYALTPYSREAGALAIVPRSHLAERQPTAHENWMVGDRTMAEVISQNLSEEEIDALDWQCPPGAVTLDLKPGDAVIWHGNTWHGGWRRELPGVRMNLATYMCRQHMLPQERKGDDRYPEVFNRYSNEPRFAQLLGENTYNGWREEGPDNSGARMAPVGIFD
ncbi:phytanoyl-CoA dioxygenase family protein [Phenylobacterium sp.]|uniref:phytanoyl-CoA dioxygenase family protein n=1 Tax=Phenylobacterium sp. TaxID=1871053 RepID=UPI0025E5652C|nr:phytanoyl-CoA dioxygenase family protein [Phenylobacterium sp.]MBX3484120.1 phytanoyl-CoA dioxygenase family protein [Phenylobacterium sp.]MCW5758483.1 phytanoyl-CoA dioxygenase family protein [Phenylobacterium sp.]